MASEQTTHLQPRHLAVQLVHRRVLRRVRRRAGGGGSLERAQRVVARALRVVVARAPQRRELRFLRGELPLQRVERRAAHVRELRVELAVAPLQVRRGLVESQLRHAACSWSICQTHSGTELSVWLGIVLTLACPFALALRRWSLECSGSP